MPRYFIRKTAPKDPPAPDSVKPEVVPSEESMKTEERVLEQVEHTVDHETLESVRTLVSWKALSRPYRKRERSYFTTIAVITILLILIAILVQEVPLVGAILALAFVTYVLAIVPPSEIEYKISTQGVTVADHFYHWGLLDSFWFTQKEGERILNILTHLRFPGQLMLVLADQDIDKLKNIIARYLPFHEIAPKSLMDNWAESLQRHFPLENPQR